MLTYVGKGFEIDLDENWRPHADQNNPGLLNFRHRTHDARLSCFGLVTEPHERDLDKLLDDYLTALLDSLDEASAALGGEMMMASYQPQQPEIGREIVVSGATPKGRFVLLAAVRPWLLFDMRAESPTLSEASVWDLLNQAQRTLFLGEIDGPSRPE